MEPDIKTAGMYDVYEWHGDDPNSDHASKAPFTVKSDDGNKTIPVNLRENTGKWNLTSRPPACMTCMNGTAMIRIQTTPPKRHSPSSPMMATRRSRSTFARTPANGT